MKLGVLPLFNEVNWASFAIDQAMRLCDKLLIIEGSQFVAFPDIPERSDDGTLDIISDKRKQYPNRIEIVNTIRENRNYRKNQCANYNFAVRHCEIGDYFVFLVADTFFSDSIIDKANQLMEDGKTDYFTAKSLIFILGFKWTFATSETYLAFKRIPTLRFYPTSRPVGLGPVKVIMEDEDRPDGRGCHHYKFVKPRERMRLRMRTSGFYKGMLEWFDENWDIIELGEGKKFNFVHNSFILRRYDGEHASILDNHPWRHVEDIRRIKV